MFLRARTFWLKLTSPTPHAMASSSSASTATGKRKRLALRSVRAELVGLGRHQIAKAINALRANTEPRSPPHVSCRMRVAFRLQCPSRVACRLAP